MGAGWCPPGMLGIGIGGTAEKAMLLAKEALMEPIDMHELRKRGPANRIEELRLELYDKVNALGIGAQGLGGLSTVLDVKILDYPTHAASLPVAMIPNCAATRHAHFTLDGSGVAKLDPPDLSLLAGRALDAVAVREARESRHAHARGSRVVEARRNAAAQRQAADRPRRRAQAHRRSSCARRARCRRASTSRNRVIYYVGPVDPVRDEVVGPAGPDDRHAHGQVHRADAREDRPARDDRQGRARARGDRGIRKHRAAYLMAVGGAAYLVSKAIRASRVVAFGDLGMEAIYEFDVKDMPVTVAVDARGKSVHHTAPRMAGADRQDSGAHGVATGTDCAWSEVRTSASLALGWRQRRRAPRPKRLDNPVRDA